MYKRKSRFTKRSTKSFVSRVKTIAKKVVKARSEKKTRLYDSWASNILRPESWGLLNNSVYVCGFAIGLDQDPLPVTTSFQGLGLNTWTQGTGYNQRVGSNMFLGKQVIIGNVEMLPRNPPNTATDKSYEVGPLKFREVHFKVKNQSINVAADSSPQHDFFVKPDGSAYGWQSVGVDRMSIEMGMLNRKRYNITMDRKYTLVPPLVQGTVASATAYHETFGMSKYNTARKFVWTNRTNKKTRFANSTNGPDRRQVDSFVLVFAIQSRDGTVISPMSADGWHINYKAYATAYDS